MKKRGLSDQERVFTNVLIALSLILVFFGTSMLTIDLSGEGASKITGLQVLSGSENFADKMTVDMQIRSQLRNEVVVLSENELSGLKSGEIITNEGTTQYEQSVRFSKMLVDTETLGKQITVDFTENDGPVDVVDSFLHIGEGVDAVNAFFEYDLEFLGGLKSDIANSEFKDLIGEVVNILAVDYEFLNALVDLSAQSVTLELVAPAIDDVIVESGTRPYLVDGVDYQITISDVTNVLPSVATIDVSGGDIDDVTFTMSRGDSNYLSDGILLAIDDIILDETPMPGYVDGESGEALFDGPMGMALNSDLVLFIADSENHVIRQVDIVSGLVTTFAGSGEAGFFDDTGTLAKFDSPSYVALSNDMGLFVADTGNDHIRKISSAGGVVTISTNNFFSSPAGIAVDEFGNVYVEDTGNNVIRKMVFNEGTSATESDNWDVTTVAGSGSKGFADGVGTAAKFSSPAGIALEVLTGTDENEIEIAVETHIYVADSENNRIRLINITEEDGTVDVSTFAGNGTAGFLDGGKDGAMFNNPLDVVMDSSGVIYIVDNGNYMVRSVVGDMVDTFAGSGEAGFANAAVDFAKFLNPSGVVVDESSGLVYIADTGNHKMRVVNGNGVSTLTGGGVIVTDLVEIFLGGTLLKLIDDDYTDDEQEVDLGYYAGVEINAEFIEDAFVQIKVNDTNLSGVSIESLRYRLTVDPIAGFFDVWVNESNDVKSFLDESEGMIGSFNIFYDGMTDVGVTLVHLTPNGNESYNLVFENSQDLVYDSSYITNEGNMFKYGGIDNMLVFKEGVVNDSDDATASNQDFTIGIEDSFILSSNGMSHVVRYDSIDTASKQLVFDELATGLKDFIYEDSTVNGTLGKAELILGGNIYMVYVANLTDNNLGTNPLAIDLNGDGVVDGSEVNLIINGGGLIDLGNHEDSVGGVWATVDDGSGTWIVDDSSLTIGGLTSSFTLISDYDSFGLDNEGQTSPESCDVVEGINCIGFDMTETTTSVTIENDIGFYLAELVVEIEGCEADENYPNSLQDGSSATFNFESCTGQDIVGAKFGKELRVTYADPSFTGPAGEAPTITQIGEIFATVQGSVLECIYEQSVLTIENVIGGKVGISPVASASCGFHLVQPDDDDDNYFGMTDYGAFMNLNDLEGQEEAEILMIEYPLNQREGLITFVTGSEVTPPEVECAVNSDCAEGEICQDNICSTPPIEVECTVDENCLSGEVCQDSVCVTPPECAVNSDCAEGLVCTDGNCVNETVAPECTSNDDCSSGKICTNEVCVISGGGDAFDTFTFDLSIDDEESIDLEEHDIILVEGLADDYELELVSVFSSGKIKFWGSLGLGTFYLEPGETINLDLDDNGVVDVNMQATDVDTIDDEAELLVKVGEYKIEVTVAPEAAPVVLPTATTPAAIPPAAPLPTAPAAPATIVKEEKVNTVLWMIIGILLVIIVLAIVILMFRSKGQKKIPVQKKPVSPW